LERGSVILFEKDGSLFNWLITKATHGPYVHVEICLGEERLIGAHGNRRGIYERDWADAPSLVTEVSLSPYADEEHIEQALTWAQEQQGHPYGWWDIASQSIKFLWPTTPLRFSKSDAWGCADYVTRYLIQAGVALPEDFMDPGKNSPNDIGRLFHLVPQRPQRIRKRERELRKGHAIAAFAASRRG